MIGKACGLKNKSKSKIIDKFFDFLIKNIKEDV
jgi:hypothetical protein